MVLLGSGLLPVADVLVNKIPVDHAPELGEVFLTVVLIIREVAVLPEIDAEHWRELERVWIHLPWLGPREAVAERGEELLLGRVVVRALWVDKAQVVVSRVCHLGHIAVDGVQPFRHQWGSSIEQRQDLEAVLVVLHEPHPPVPKQREGLVIELRRKMKNMNEEN